MWVAGVQCQFNSQYPYISRVKGSVTELRGFAAWGVLLKNKMWWFLGGFIYLQEVKEMVFASKALPT